MLQASLNLKFWLSGFFPNTLAKRALATLKGFHFRGAFWPWDRRRLVGPFRRLDGLSFLPPFPGWREREKGRCTKMGPRTTERGKAMVNSERSQLGLCSKKKAPYHNMLTCWCTFMSLQSDVNMSVAFRYRCFLVSVELQRSSRSADTTVCK